MRIVAMDLGKNKSVVCDYDSESGRHTFTTIRTRPQEVHDLLVEKQPDRVVIETGPVSGWVSHCVGADSPRSPAARAAPDGRCEAKYRVGKEVADPTLLHAARKRRGLRFEGWKKNAEFRMMKDEFKRRRIF